MHNKLLLKCLTQIMAYQTTTIEILCSMSAGGNIEKQNELLKIAKEQCQLYQQAMNEALGDEILMM